MEIKNGYVVVFDVLLAFIVFYGVESSYFTRDSLSLVLNFSFFVVVNVAVIVCLLFYKGSMALVRIINYLI